MLLIVKFYPEDIERMQKMSSTEKAYYKLTLVGNGRYVRDHEEWRKRLVAGGWVKLGTKRVSGINWTYTVKDGVASIGDGFDSAIPTSTSGEIVIPSVLAGCPVTHIGDDAFKWCENLTGVTIPDSVTSIGEGAYRLDDTRRRDVYRRGGLFFL